VTPLAPSSRPPYDPRQRIELEPRDHGPITVWRPDAQGRLTPREERSLTMDVCIDDEYEIVDGLALRADDRFVAFHECGQCGLWECNLIEGYAAKVVRFGPYVLWLHPGGRVFTFDADDYARALGGAIDALPTLTDDDAWNLETPDREASYRGADGAVLSVADDDGPLAPLRGWPENSLGDVHPVAPPPEAIEVRALNGRSASVWIDARPRDDGRRAAYLPAVTGVRVWCAGPAVDRVVAALLADG